MGTVLNAEAMLGLNKVCRYLDRRINLICIIKFSACIKKAADISKSFCSHRNVSPRWNVLFFGTDDFSVRSLDILCHELKSSSLIGRLEVVTSTRSPKPNAVQKFAVREELRIHPWPMESPPSGFDIGLVSSFGHLIPKKIIDSFPMGMLNVHASLLPRWRGAAPVVYSILNGDTETGVSIMQVRPHRFDIGAVLKQKRCSIGPKEKSADLLTKLAGLGAEALIEVVRSLPQSLEWAIPQSEDGITYAPKVTQELYQVDWSQMSAQDVYNLYRALGSVSTQWLGMAVRLLHPDPPWETDIPEGRPGIPGTVIIDRPSGRLQVACNHNSWVAFATVAVPGKRPMSSADFYNGYLSKRPRSDWLFS